jgi:hypothetical protein
MTTSEKDTLINLPLLSDLTYREWHGWMFATTGEYNSETKKKSKVYSSDTEFRLYSDKDDIRGEAYVEEVTSPIWQDNVN